MRIPLSVGWNNIRHYSGYLRIPFVTIRLIRQNYWARQNSQVMLRRRVKFLKQCMHSHHRAGLSQSDILSPATQRNHLRDYERHSVWKQFRHPADITECFDGNEINRNSDQTLVGISSHPPCAPATPRDVRCTRNQRKSDAFGERHAEIASVIVAGDGLPSRSTCSRSIRLPLIWRSDNGWQPGAMLYPHIWWWCGMCLIQHK